MKSAGAKDQVYVFGNPAVNDIVGTYLVLGKLSIVRVNCSFKGENPLSLQK